jgi:outer membrane biosynthesis protein TonB
MEPRPRRDQTTIDRQIARRRFIALSTLAALALLLLSTSVASQATSLVVGGLRGAGIVPDGHGPQLADNQVASQRRPASLTRRHAVNHPSTTTSPSSEWVPAAAPADPGSAPIALVPAESSPAGGEVPAPGSQLPAKEPPVQTPPKTEPPPKEEPKSEPPKSEPPEEEPPKSEPPPKEEPKTEPPPKEEPTKPVEEPPAIPTEAPIFAGEELGDFETVEAAKGAITEVPDPLGSGQTVLKMTVDDDDVYPITPTENPRAQALSPDIIENGDEFWLQTKFLLPQDFPSKIPGWVGLGSIYGEPFGGPSPWQLDIEGEHINWPRNSLYNWDVPWQMPIVKGQWITVLLHERFAKDGWVEMWVNGQPITFFSSGGYNPSQIAPTQHLEMQTMDKSNNGGPNAAKIANYRLEGMFDSLTVYFGTLKLGETRESVEG